MLAYYLLILGYIISLFITEKRKTKEYNDSNRSTSSKSEYNG